MDYPSRVFVKYDTLRQDWLNTKRYVTLVPVSDNTFQQVATNYDVRLFEFKDERDSKILNYFYSVSNPDVMVKHELANPSTEALKSCEGTYYNATYVAQFSLHIENCQLVIKNLHYQSIAFRPINKMYLTERPISFLELSSFGTNQIKSKVLL